MASFNVGETNPAGLVEHNNKVYMVGGSGNKLYEIDVDSGDATAVGSSVVDFGVGEQKPTGLESFNGKLYMIGETHNRLYELDPDTGEAVASRPYYSDPGDYGVGETHPTGLCAHNGELYMTGTATNNLYTLNVDTGRATRVGNETNFGVTDLEIHDLTSDGTNLWGVGKVVTSGSVVSEGIYELYITPANGYRAGQAAHSIVETFGGRASGSVEAIATDGTTTWLVGTNQNRLARLDLETGRARDVSPLNTANNFGSANVTHPVDLEYNDSTLYMIGGSSSQSKKLYSVDTSTGLATEINSEPLRTGPGSSNYLANDVVAMGGVENGKLVIAENTTVSSSTGGFGVMEDNPTSMATDGATMWMVGDDQDKLYTLSLTNTKVDITLDSSVPSLTTSNVEFGDGSITLPSGPPAFAASTITGSGTSWEITFNHALTNFQLSGMVLRIVDTNLRVNLSSYVSQRRNNEWRFNSGLSGGNTGIRGITVTGSTSVASSADSRSGNPPTLFSSWDLTLSGPLRAGEASTFNMSIIGGSGQTVTSIANHARNITLAALDGSTTTETVARVGTSTNFGLGAGATKATGLTYVGAQGTGTLYMVAEHTTTKRFYSLNTTTGVATRVGTHEFTAVGDLANDGTDIWMVSGGNTFGKITTAGVYSASRNTQHGLTNVTGLTNSGDLNQSRVYAITSTSGQNGTLYSTSLGNGQIKLTFNKIIGGFATTNLTLGGLAGRSITDAQPAATLPTAEWIITLDQAITNSQVTAAGTTFTLASAITGTKYLRFTISSSQSNLIAENFVITAYPGSVAYTVVSAGPVGSRPTNEWYLELNRTFNDSQSGSFTVVLASRIVTFEFSNSTTLTGVSGAPRSLTVATNGLNSDGGGAQSARWFVEFTGPLTAAEISSASWSFTGLLSGVNPGAKFSNIANITVNASTRQALGKGATVSSKTNLYANTRHGSANAVGVANTRGLLNQNRTSPPNFQSGLYMLSTTNSGVLYRVDETGATAATAIAGNYARTTDVTNFYTVNTGTAEATAVTNTTHGLTHVKSITQIDAAGDEYAVLKDGPTSNKGTLYRLNIGTAGPATVIGTADSIDIDSLTNIRNTNFGTAASGTSIYAVGTANSGSLYQLDYTTATIKYQVMPAYNFGFYQDTDREKNPTGIAWGNNTMYMIGHRTTGAGPNNMSTLYVLDKETGRALADQYAGFNMEPYGLMYYEASSSNKRIYTFNILAGSGSRGMLSTQLTGSGKTTTFGSIGFSGALYDPSVENQPRGFDHITISGTIGVYGVGQQHAQIYRLGASANPSTIGSLGSGYATNSLQQFGQQITTGKVLFNDKGTGTGSLRMIAGAGNWVTFRFTTDVINVVTTDVTFSAAPSPTVTVVKVLNATDAAGAFTARQWSVLFSRKLTQAEAGNVRIRTLTPSSAEFTDNMYLVHYNWENLGGITQGPTPLDTVSEVRGAVASGTDDLFLTAGKFGSPDEKALYRADLSDIRRRTVTIAQRGTAVDFNESEDDPGGLAEHNGTLYMVGSANDTLYSVDPVTGIATRIPGDSAHEFGVGEKQPQGLTTHHHHLYMVGQERVELLADGSRATHTGTLYRVGTKSGLGTVVGPEVKAFGVGETQPIGLADHRGTLYMVGDTKRALFSVETAGDNAGVATPVRPMRPSQFGASESNPQGMQYHDGTWYFVGSDTNYLATLDLDLGEATRVGNATNYGVDGLEILDLTSDGVNLYGSGRANNGWLVSFDMGTSVPGVTVSNVTDIPAGVTVLSVESYRGDIGWYVYFSRLLTDTEAGRVRLNGVLPTSGGGVTVNPTASASEGLYILNTNDGTAKLASESFGVGETHPAGLASDGSTHWMIGAATRKVYTIDLGPAPYSGGGELTALNSAITNFNVGETAPTGIAYFGTAGSGTLYMVGNNNKTLYAIKTRSGETTSPFSASTPLGAAVSIGRLRTSTRRGNINDNISDLASNGSTLWLAVNAISDGATTIYEINLNNAIVTPIANTTHGLSNVDGLTYYANDASIPVLAAVSRDRSGTTSTLSVFDATQNDPAGPETWTNPTINTVTITSLVNLRYTLPSDTNSVFMVGEDNGGSLYKVDQGGTGGISETRIPVTNFGLSGADRAQAAYGLAYGDDKFWMSDSKSGASKLFTVSDTGKVLTTSGSPLATATDPQGLDYISGTTHPLHVIDDQTDQVYSYNWNGNDGAAVTTSSTGTPPRGFGVSEGSPRAIAQIPGSTRKVYVIGADTDAILELNISHSTGHGTATFYGMPPGFGHTPPIAAGAINGLVSDGTELHLLTTEGIYTIFTQDMVTFIFNSPISGGVTNSDITGLPSDVTILNIEDENPDSPTDRNKRWRVTLSRILTSSEATVVRFKGNPSDSHQLRERGQITNSDSDYAATAALAPHGATYAPGEPAEVITFTLADSDAAVINTAAVRGMPSGVNATAVEDVSGGGTANTKWKVTFDRALTDAEAESITLSGATPESHVGEEKLYLTGTSNTVTFTLSQADATVVASNSEITGTVISGGVSVEHFEEVPASIDDTVWKVRFSRPLTQTEAGTIRLGSVPKTPTIARLHGSLLTGTLSQPGTDTATSSVILGSSPAAYYAPDFQGAASSTGVPAPLERSPRGLAYLNGVLYMAGASGRRLYSLARSTGVLTRTGIPVPTPVTPTPKPVPSGDSSFRRGTPQQFTAQSGGNSRLIFGQQENYYTRIPVVDTDTIATQVSTLNKYYKYIPIVTSITIADQTETIAIEFLKGSSSANKQQQGPFRYGGGFSIGASTEGTQLFFQGITNDKEPEFATYRSGTDKTLKNEQGTIRSYLDSAEHTGRAAAQSAPTLKNMSTKGNAFSLRPDFGQEIANDPQNRPQTEKEDHPERLIIEIQIGYSGGGKLQVRGWDYHGQKIVETVGIPTRTTASTELTTLYTRSYFCVPPDYESSNSNTHTRVSVSEDNAGKDNALVDCNIVVKSLNEEVRATFDLQDRDFLGGWTVEAQKGQGVVHVYVGVYPVSMTVSLARTSALTYDFEVLAWDMFPYENAAGVQTDDGYDTVGGVSLNKHVSTDESLIYYPGAADTDSYAPDDGSRLRSGDLRHGHPAFKNSPQELYTGWQCQLLIGQPKECTDEPVVIPLLDTTFTVNQTIEQAEMIIGERNPGPLFRAGLREVTLSGTMLLTRDRNWIQEFRDNDVFENGQLILSNIITGGFPYKTIFHFGYGQLTTAPDATVDGLGLVAVPFNLMFFDEDLGDPTDFYIEAVYHQDDWFRGDQEIGGLMKYS